MIQTEITGKDFDRLYELSTKGWNCTKKKPSKWGDGQFGDPNFPVFVGILGEVSFGLVFGLEPELSVGYGAKNKQDFVLDGLRFEIKTTKTNLLLVRAQDSYGAEVPLVSDVYVGIKLAELDFTRKYTKTEIHGIITREALRVLPKVPGRSFGADWLNYEIPLAELTPLEIA